MLLGNGGGKGAKARHRLFRRDDPGGYREWSVVAQYCPVDQRLPDRLLAGGEHRRGCPPRAHEDRCGKNCPLTDKCTVPAPPPPDAFAWPNPPPPRCRPEPSLHGGSLP